MALTIAANSLQYHSSGDQSKRNFKVNFDDSYTQGGEVLLAAKVGLTVFQSVNMGLSGGYLYEPVISANGTSVALKVISIGGQGGSQEIVYDKINVRGSAGTNSENADSATLPTNGIYLKGLATFTSYAGTIVPSTQPDIARNALIFIANDSGGSLDLFEGVTTFTVTGTYNGAAQVEAITFTSTAMNKAVATARNRYKYGVEPFSTITNVTITNAPAGALKAGLGLGSLIGLTAPLFTPAEADVTQITKNGANVPVAGLVSTTNNTVNLNPLTEVSTFEITFLTDSGGEIPNNTDLSTLINVPVEAYGY